MKHMYCHTPPIHIEYWDGQKQNRCYGDTKGTSSAGRSFYNRIDSFNLVLITQYLT